MQKALLIGTIFALLGTNAGAQTAPEPTGQAMHLIRLPNGDYTAPLSELEGSGTTGSVTLHPEGLKTIFTVLVSGKPSHIHAFSLHSGSDCRVIGAPWSISLAPARTGQPSRTIVSLPITSLTAKDYSLTAQDATFRQQFEEACARL